MELTPEILKDALRRYDEIEMSKVPNKEDLHFEYSRRFERKMRRLIRKVDTPARYRLQHSVSIGNHIGHLCCSCDRRRSAIPWLD